MPPPAPARPYKSVAKLIIRALSAAAQRGSVEFGGFRAPCALGRSGVRVLKREGDGATPRGRYRLRRILYRPIGPRPRAVLDLHAVRRNEGWCDETMDRNYNRPIKFPYRGSAERLWREDGLYDIVVVLGYNDVPRIRNRGSAIFMHVARAGLQPTEGCIALSASDLRRLVARLPRRSEIIIEI
jgi:L,D-peptidoglycan transpeptidase YkuD (ErfK/YbiS/YcfS/YnhG family)